MLYQLSYIPILRSVRRFYKYITPDNLVSTQKNLCPSVLVWEWRNSKQSGILSVYFSLEWKNSRQSGIKWGTKLTRRGVDTVNIRGGTLICTFIRSSSSKLLHYRHWLPVTQRLDGIDNKLPCIPMTTRNTCLNCWLAVCLSLCN